MALYFIFRRMLRLLNLEQQPPDSAATRWLEPSVTEKEQEEIASDAPDGWKKHLVKTDEQIVEFNKLPYYLRPHPWDIHVRLSEGYWINPDLKGPTHSTLPSLHLDVMALVIDYLEPRDTLHLSEALEGCHRYEQIVRYLVYGGAWKKRKHEDLIHQLKQDRLAREKLK